MSDYYQSISVIIPVKNEELYISNLLDSVISTSYPHDHLQVIVVDGMSEDNTWHIIERYLKQNPSIIAIKNQSKIGRLGIKTLLYYVGTSLIAILIGLTLANLIQPGIGAATIDQVGAFDTSKLSSSTSILDILKRMIPLNPISALASGDILGIIFFAIFFGIVMNFVDTKHSSNIKEFITSLYQVIMKITQKCCNTINFSF